MPESHSALTAPASVAVSFSFDCAVFPYAGVTVCQLLRISTSSHHFTFATRRRAFFSSTPFTVIDACAAIETESVAAFQP